MTDPKSPHHTKPDRLGAQLLPPPVIAKKEAGGDITAWFRAPNLGCRGYKCQQSYPGNTETCGHTQNDWTWPCP